MGKPDDSDASVASLAGQAGGTYWARASTHLSPNRGPLARVRATAQHSDDDSENDAEVSSDARAPSPNAGTYPMSYPLAKPHCDRLAGKVRPAINSEASASLARSLCECALFVCGVVAVLIRMLHSVPEIRDKACGVIALSTFVLVCFACHARRACGIWATQISCLRKTDPSDPLYALLLPLVSSAQLLDIAPEAMQHGGGALAPPWMQVGRRGTWRADRVGASPDRIVGRGALLDLHVICAFVFCVHLMASQLARAYSKRRGSHAHEGPTSRLLMCFYTFSLLVAVAGVGVQVLARSSGYGHLVLSHTPTWATFLIAVLYQCLLFLCTRVARQNCTLGELAMIGGVGTALWQETVISTMARLVPSYAQYYFREPSAIVLGQLALVAGMLLIGLVLSPLLVLSRNLAQRPTHRLRWPLKRNLHRRLLALSFFLLSAAMVLCVLSPWLAWQLHKRSAWLYFARFMLQGPHWWSRLALLVYWGLLCNTALLSIQLMVNRMWQYATVGDQVKASSRTLPPSTAPSVQPQRTVPTATERASTLAATQFAERGEREESTSLGPRVAVSVNGRRKFFHALAVLLFVPGIAWDPAFMHVAFSAALALFVLCEYLRYCAVFPLGAMLHFFLSQFLDSKDCGLVILSHAYLLTGCAAGVWIESQSRITQQLGVLVLGVGDSVASIVGRQYGRIHWPLSSKTVEGTLGFVVSMTASVMVLRMLRLVEAFHTGALCAIMTLLAVIEGVSEQNDNLVLPLSGIFLTSMIPLRR